MTGFGSDGVTVANGTEGTLTNTVAGTTWTQVVTPDGNGDYSLTVAADAATDAAGNAVAETSASGAYGAFTFDPTSLEITETDAATTGTYTIELASAPSGDVTVTITVASGGSDDVTVADTDAGTAGVQNTLTFTTGDWDTEQTVTVNVAADGDPDDDSATLAHSASGGGYGSVTGSVAVTVDDDDTKGVELSSITISASENAGTTTYTVALGTAPAADVTLTIASDDTSVATVDTDGATDGNQDTLTFTTTSWESAQTVTVAGVDDDVDNASDRTATISFEADSTDDDYDTDRNLTATDVTFTATDDDTRGFTLDPSPLAITEGDTNAVTGTYTVVLDSEPTAQVVVTVAKASGGSDDVTITDDDADGTQRPRDRAHVHDGQLGHRADGDGDGGGGRQRLLGRVGDPGALGLGRRLRLGDREPDRERDRRRREEPRLLAGVGHLRRVDPERLVHLPGEAERPAVGRGHGVGDEEDGQQRRPLVRHRHRQRPARRPIR